MKTNKQTNPKGSVILKLFLILLALFVVVAIIGGVVRGISGDNTLTLASLFKRMFSLESLIKGGGSGKTAVTATASAGESTLELSSLGNLQLTAADKSVWPKDAIGGLYKIEPSGKFEQPARIRIKYAKDPGAFFVLGYFDPAAQKWDYLPTIKKEPGVYETIITHASFVGGTSNPNYKPQFTDPQNQAAANEISGELEKVQQEQQTGKDQGGNWQNVWEKTKKLTDKLVKDLCDAINGKTPLEFTKSSNYEAVLHDFLVGWEITQYLGFSTLQTQFEDAIDSAFPPDMKTEELTTRKLKCEKKDKISAYFINQTDTYDNQLNLNLSQGLYKANLTAQTKISSAGQPSIQLPASEIGWRTTWRVYQSSVMDSVQSQRLYKEYRSPDAYGLIDFGNQGLGTETTDLMMLEFNLAGVKEGQSFPIKQKRVGPYVSRTNPGAPPMTGVLIHKSSDSNYEWRGTRSMDSTQTIDPGFTIEATGILLKDHGADGAVIGFEAKPMMTPEQLQQFKAATAGAPAELANLYDSQGNPTFVSGDKASKPLLITRNKPEEQKPEDDWQGSEAERQNILENSKTNPNDLDGDGIPDLVPLVPPNTKN
ncbi:MAG: hypothetical protein NTZ97_00790 [Candidatus Moranbacteria bacterium]|nr:hypothetical protein [Candidatus Moranbacteria bacterium]